jgi:hypothetical protein
MSSSAVPSVKPPYKCASCGHEWTDDAIWCPKCRVGYRQAGAKSGAVPSVESALAKLRARTADSSPHIGYASISHEEAAALLRDREAMQSTITDLRNRLNYSEMLQGRYPEDAVKPVCDYAALVALRNARAAIEAATYPDPQARSDASQTLSEIDNALALAQPDAPPRAEGERS